VWKSKVEVSVLVVFDDFERKHLFGHDETIVEAEMYEVENER
jgi:hypothetical protein